MSVLEITTDNISESTICALLKEVEAHIHKTSKNRLKIFIKIMEVDEQNAGILG